MLKGGARVVLARSQIVASSPSADSLDDRLQNRPVILERDSVLGRHRIVELLGEGGVGKVYRAEDPELGREVAIKVLPTEVAGDPER